jgi:hypothetical protein
LVWFLSKRIGTDTKGQEGNLKAIVSIKEIRQLLTEWVLIMVECTRSGRTVKANNGV